MIALMDGIFALPQAWNRVLEAMGGGGTEGVGFAWLMGGLLYLIPAWVALGRRHHPAGPS